MAVEQQAPETEESYSEDEKQVYRDLVKMVNGLQERVKDLEDENSELHARIREKDERIDALEVELQESIQQQASDRARMVSSVREDIADVEKSLEDERETRARSQAKLRKRVSHLASEAGVEIDEDALSEDDKLVRLVRNGPEDVVTNPRKNAQRAYDLLTEINNSDYAHTAQTKQGSVAVFKSTTVRPLLKERYDMDFNSSQIARVFAKVEDIGAESPRRVEHDKTTEQTEYGEKNVHRLRIWRPEQLMGVAEGMN